MGEKSANLYLLAEKGELGKMAKAKIHNVLFVTTEAEPFASTGGMGEVCSSLPRALNKTKKTDARVMMPLYEEIAYRYKSEMTFICNITVALAWRYQYF